MARMSYGNGSGFSVSRIPPNINFRELAKSLEVQPVVPNLMNDRGTPNQMGQGPNPLVGETTPSAFAVPSALDPIDEATF